MPEEDQNASRRRIRRRREEGAPHPRPAPPPHHPDAEPSPAGPRAEAPVDPATSPAALAPSGPSAMSPPAPRPYKHDSEDRRRDSGERGLRGLIGAGPTQVGVAAAMRARDAARIRPEDLAAAEAELNVVRRHYVPPPA